MPAWLDRLISAGIVTTDPKLARRQKLVNIASYAGSFNAASRVVANLFYQQEHLLTAEIVSGLSAVTALLIHRLHRYGDHAGAMGVGIWFIFSVVSATLMFGLRSQIQVYFAFSGAMWFMYGTDNWRQVLAWMAVLVGVLLALMAFAPQQGLAIPEDDTHVGFLAVQSMLNVVAINAVLIFYALFMLGRAENEAERERKRAEALLSVVLPAEVADRLRAEPDKHIADRLDGVSILFADLAGFTEAAHSESPEKVVTYLDEFVHACDELCERNGVGKIKTIGDAYMAAGGLQGESRAGAIGIGRLAIAMMELQERRPPLGAHKLRLRVGIHTGSAIAGVIGDTRISYDLWGDAVNMASRMETYGEPGRIRVSDAFRKAADGAFEFQELSPAEIKGIGVARTHFLVAAR